MSQPAPDADASASDISPEISPATPPPAPPTEPAPLPFGVFRGTDKPTPATKN